MQPLNYRAETPDKIKNLPVCTPAEIQEYLQLCLKLTATIPLHNILQFPYDPITNPYAVFYGWLKQSNFQIQPAPTPRELVRIEHLAQLSTKVLRNDTDSITILNSPKAKIGPPDATKLTPYVQHFSQIYALDQIFNSLFVYNFLLENYIHESRKLRKTITENSKINSTTWHGRLHHTWVSESEASHQYNYWVRSFLLREGVDQGNAAFAQFAGYSFEKSYYRHHPIIQPANRTNAVEAHRDNQKLINGLRSYRYYHFLQPTTAESAFFTELRNDSGDFVNNPLLSQGLETLQRAVDLSGRLSRHIVYLSEHRTVHH